MFIDTHCHLQKEFYVDINDVINQNREANVVNIIVSGCTRKEIEEVIKYSKKYDDIYLTIGFHPENSDVITGDDLIWLRTIIENNSKIVGIGEIGLDYHYDNLDKEKQKKLFLLQLSMAQELGLPVVIHSRDATNDTIEILKKYSLKGVIHCFSGSYETAQTYIKMGYLLGIGGVVTFKNSKLKDVVKKISLDNIVLETDSPYLSPEPYRGKLNSSKNIPIIASFLADCYKVSLEDISNVTTHNARRVFNLK